ncbi:NAD(P)H dehydrogenase [quinone] 1-like isoform X1 [Protopterus annectens]|uniref:NAD(P)H dehydrogenase [quinone] 1-like isoform X1 n=1 Tax=Protopterus annectens TaxID=7888 RepID=UPI001CFA8B41|nr:NAD(P)H dehydrogenase [quinone] 1-like isoform X1 [Protopterus annectens]
MAGKNALIVFAHQEKTSFNSALKDAAVESLKKTGWDVTVSDLYEMKFNAVLSRDDIIGNPKNPNHFNYAFETMEALEEGRLSKDIIAEQNKLRSADLVIFQFPLYWLGMPAIMKGWLERVFTQGFAYTLQNIYDNGLFKNKKALLSLTTGGSSTMYSPQGINGDINVMLWPLQNGILHFCGFQVLSPQIFWSPEGSSNKARTKMIELWKARLENISQEDPIHFVPTAMFDMSAKGGFQLKKEVQKSNTNEHYGLSVGQHLGKGIPPNNQYRSEK